MSLLCGLSQGLTKDMGWAVGGGGVQVCVHVTRCDCQCKVGDRHMHIYVKEVKRL